MKRIFIIITYIPEENEISVEYASIMLKNVISELISTHSFEIQGNTIKILTEEKNIPAIENSLRTEFHTVNFQYIIDTCEDKDQWNQRLNSHIQRAAVSSGVDYLMLISVVPILTIRSYRSGMVVKGW